jgi:6-pyruvoyl-tetrahydropterin synthase
MQPVECFYLAQSQIAIAADTQHNHIIHTPSEQPIKYPTYCNYSIVLWQRVQPLLMDGCQLGYLPIMWKIALLQEKSKCSN